MTTKIKATIISLLLTVGVLTITGCSNTNNVTTIADISYKRNMEENAYTVYLLENNIYVPYFVLTESRKTNSVILLRKYLLDDNMIYNPNEPYSAYYSGSNVDKYLTNEFPSRFSPDLFTYITESQIKITSKDSLYTGAPITETISRLFFLLSCSEVFGNGSKTVATEGNVLSFFLKEDNRIAKHEDNTTDIWWLRTPDTWYDTLVCTVGVRGNLGICGVGGVEGENSNSVRPAFCLKSDTEIINVDGKNYLLGFNP